MYSLRPLLERGVVAYGLIGMLGGAAAAALGCMLGIQGSGIEGQASQLFLGASSQPDLAWGLTGGVLGLTVGTCLGLLQRSAALPILGALFGAAGLALINPTRSLSLGEAIAHWAMLGAITGAVGGIVHRLFPSRAPP